MEFTEEPLVNVLEVLRKRGYTEDFNLLEECISYKTDGNAVDISDMVIDKIYRFTGLNDVEDEAILYAITYKKDNVKGVIVNGYATNADSGTNKIIDQIPVEIIEEDWLKK
ncbi:hypothetical protein [Cytophaga hutchinsonii]|uniref:Phosphoribosylpyrophosphate synthetase n=1 Tax=Cytophaga hutchinsonii (strain ATCC 33406 / DSM 1761 / CIP 103989 / NBRC 15051 / NCIMB 9469 / D465) TaxID=269798 RepID=A0A6N4SNF9_CYTH3|nr:hypothetical protein [Cytophaga hutchinsonii]ABG57820.1 hypothetical protein CHU_0533 [Cytophaga hutchinsonii ATCC 33406]SFX06437.1 hypothetical protein SAMN04487930_101372 [Cytophaga hutchinsonii ATCC 33406]